MDDLWRLNTDQRPSGPRPLVFTFTVNAALHQIRKKRGPETKCVFVWLSGWLAAMIPTQRSAEIKGTETKTRRKGLVSHAGGCQGCLPQGTQISSLSQIRNEQKFNWVRQTVWYQVATMTIQTGSALLCLPLMGFHSGFYRSWEKTSASQMWMKYC